MNTHRKWSTKGGLKRNSLWQVWHSECLYHLHTNMSDNKGSCLFLSPKGSVHWQIYELSRKTTRSGDKDDSPGIYSSLDFRGLNFSWSSAIHDEMLCWYLCRSVSVWRSYPPSNEWRTSGEPAWSRCECPFMEEVNHFHAGVGKESLVADCIKGSVSKVKEDKDDDSLAVMAARACSLKTLKFLDCQKILI